MKDQTTVVVIFHVKPMRGCEYASSPDGICKRLSHSPCATMVPCPDYAGLPGLRLFFMSFLVIDIGNTRLKWGLYDQPAPGAALLAHGAVPLEDIDHLWDQHWSRLPAPRVSSSRLGGGVVNGYEHPQRLGADRWAAIIGARQRALLCSPNDAQPVLAV